jgi:hypothetical protein
MAADLAEEDMIKEYVENERMKEEGGVNDYSKGVAMSRKEIDEEFDNLDVNSFNKQDVE